MAVENDLMFEFHALQESRVERAPLHPAAPRPSIGAALIPYAWKMALFIGIAFTAFDLPIFATVPDMQDLAITNVYNCIVIFMRMFGFVAFVSYLVSAYYVVVDYENQQEQLERQWKLYEEIQRSKLPGPKPQTVELTIKKETPSGYHEESRTIVNPPTLEFLTWLWKSASSTGRVPGERVAERELGAVADHWLDVLTKEGFLEKVGTNNNSRRRIVAGTTFTEVCARFGYSPAPSVTVSAIAQTVPQRTAPHRTAAPPAEQERAA